MSASTPYSPYAVAVAPGLDRRQKRSAFWAGFLALNLLSLGGTLVSLALLVTVLVSFFLSAAGQSSADVGEPAEQFGDRILGLLEQYSAPTWIVGIALLGVVVIVAGLFASYGILRAGRVARPWAVTWSAVGISVPVMFVLWFISTIVAQLVSAFSAFSMFTAVGSGQPGSMASPEDAIGVGIALAVVGVVISIAVVGVVGWLIWWWMAHAFRSRVPVA